MYGLIVFQEKYDRAVRALGQMKESIERYESKPDHNPKYLAMQQERLADLVSFVKIAGQACNELEQNSEQAYSAGVKKGREIEKRNSGAVPIRELRYYDAEAYRRDTISKAKAKWAELY